MKAVGSEHGQGTLHSHLVGCLLHFDYKFQACHSLLSFSLDHKRLVLSLVLCLCSALSKEMGITVVAIFMVYEFFILNKVILHHYMTYVRSTMT